jgi:hypothetical protein
MFQDQFYQIHQSEAFKISQCMQHEHALANFFSSLLTNLGYSTVDPVRRIWKRANKTVIVCLADDFNICGADLSKSADQWFDVDTTIITDNFITAPTQYRVLQLPTSYFGIFGYTPHQQHYDPQKRFHFSVNRLDTQRQLILFELLGQSGGLDQVLDQDYINFNAMNPGSINDTVEDIQTNFKKSWEPVANFYSDTYNQDMSAVVRLLPVRNHTLSIEQANVGAYLNLVVETYAGNTTVTFSEKTFRSLVTPSPWTLFAARGAVEYIKNLGFDVMLDLIDHSYDSDMHDHWPGNSRIKKYISSSIQQYQHLTTLSKEHIANRATIAAKHNQQLLQKMKINWPRDFAAWLPEVIAQLE